MDAEPRASSVSQDNAWTKIPYNSRTATDGAYPRTLDTPWWDTLSPQDRAALFASAEAALPARHVSTAVDLPHQAGRAVGVKASNPSGQKRRAASRAGSTGGESSCLSTTPAGSDGRALVTPAYSTSGNAVRGRLP
ncbi:hypothetical protein [Kutzneria buriramensis]|uniref:hypothetical protein n=1 Tax=Kutzneria buriramensis TaxID=1045776 RepID=UPI0011C15738|nr:hypothetical protein [Kutzneria buriramensis]